MGAVQVGVGPGAADRWVGGLVRGAGAAGVAGTGTTVQTRVVGVVRRLAGGTREPDGPAELLPPHQLEGGRGVLDSLRGREPHREVADVGVLVTDELLTDLVVVRHGVGGGVEQVVARIGSCSGPADCRGVAVLRAAISRRRVGRVDASPVVNGDVRPTGRECQQKFTTDPFRAAGHQCCPSLQVRC